MLTTFNIPLVFIGTASLILSVAAQECSGIECSDNQYCAANKCVEQGTCTKDMDCLNPLNEFQDQLNKMLGHFECTNSTCEKVRGACKDGIDHFECLKDPCSSGQDSCVSDYCGGCNAIYFDAGGNVMDDPVDNTCTSGKDCGEDQYCADNKCLDHARCKEDMDCVNPSNKFQHELNEMFGHFKCNGGTCGKVGGCEDKSEPVQCKVDPCSMDTRVGEGPCVSDYCDGCNAIYFDAGGNVMDDPVDKTFECADSPFDIKNKKISRKQFKRSEGKGEGCELVAARNASRCSNLPFRTHCPATCARILGDGAGILCKPDMDTYCTDSKKKWRAPGSGKVRSCKYIGKKQNQIVNRCKKYGVTKTCPLTCGAPGCEAP